MVTVLISFLFQGYLTTDSFNQTLPTGQHLRLLVLPPCFSTIANPARDLQYTRNHFC
jgi:hypothetical protein